MRRRAASSAAVSSALARALFATSAPHPLSPTPLTPGVCCFRKEAAKRNPSIILYGLPWAWAGWLGFGTNSPYANVTATADYTAKWIECGACHMHTRSALRRPWTAPGCHG